MGNQFCICSNSAEEQDKLSVSHQNASTILRFDDEAKTEKKSRNLSKGVRVKTKRELKKMTYFNAKKADPNDLLKNKQHKNKDLRYVLTPKKQRNLKYVNCL